ncbi:hypothetical protein ACFXTH_041990 [Malus domestica]
MWFFRRKGPSGFSSSSTAEEVTEGIDATGASSGIGTETARVLALRGAHVVMAVRNMAAGKDAREQREKAILSSLSSVRKFASDFNSSGLPLTS